MKGFTVLKDADKFLSYCKYMFSEDETTSFSFLIASGKESTKTKGLYESKYSNEEIGEIFKKHLNFDVEVVDINMPQLIIHSENNNIIGKGGFRMNTGEWYSNMEIPLETLQPLLKDLENKMEYMTNK